ncbi:MAG: MotA/TolQ/ExbB proton channel family protein [Candidatus Omnitrophica bacterium]|nr:MotA/TolQ/ExbB proton channel family protein [Candidatus Omnitrophota bacterium]
MDLWKMSAWRIFLAGGPLMWPILLCSVLALAIAIEKFLHLQRIRIDFKGFLDAIIEKLKRSNIKEAISICDSVNAPISGILRAGIIKYTASRDEIKESMEDASLYEIPKLEKNLSALATIAHVSPLLGLLGTVTGMVRAFQVIQMKATSLNPVSPGDLAGGIWEALLTTVAGLVVAIPTFVAYNFFVSRVNSIIVNMERVATELLNFITQQSGSTKKE